MRVRRGKVWTTDGPLAKTKELLGSYFLIEARDRDDVISSDLEDTGRTNRMRRGVPIAEDAETLRTLGNAAPFAVR
jgi:hypothetical protein